MNLLKAGKLIATFGTALTLAACGNGGGDTTDTADTSANGGETAGGDFDTSQTINVVTREDGSGTRGAFTEITGILVEEGDTETDNTYAGATIQNGTNGVMTTVSGDPAAIGYISAGSVDDSIKPVMVDGAEPTPEAIADGSYPIARPFNVAYGNDLSDVAEDFWSFIFSAEGQEIVAAEGYIEADTEAPAYEATEGLSGSVSVVGSTSVSPVMEVMAEEYQALNPDVSIDITSNGSSAGMTAAMDGSADIGMASRELKEEESAELTSDALAIDGIAVIANNENPVEDLTMEEVRQIFTGEVTEWSAVID